MSKEHSGVLAYKEQDGTARPQSPGVAVLRAIVTPPDAAAAAEVPPPAAPAPSTPAPAAPTPAPAAGDDLTERLESAITDIRRIMAARRPGRG